MTNDIDKNRTEYDDWLDDLDKISSIVSEVAKSLNINKVYLYGEYTNPLIYSTYDKVVRIATKTDELLKCNRGVLEAWDILEQKLSDDTVAFTDYEYLIAGKSDTGFRHNDLIMFKCGNKLLYARNEELEK